jgi:UDP-glucose 4-epimerase
MKFLVTGGAGFIGSNLVDYLINLNYEVVVIDNESSSSNEFFYYNKKAKYYNIDICNYDLIKPVFENIDCVFHLAAESRIQPSLTSPITTIKTNVLGTAIVLQCSVEAGVKRFIYSSTSSAYGKNNTPNIEYQSDDCLTPYSVSKVSGEKLCRVYYDLFGLETISLRYFNVYGHRQPVRGNYAPLVGLFQKQIESGMPLTIVGDGNQRRDFTHVNDVVEANFLSATKEISPKLFGTVFNIGTGVNYSINEIAEIFNHKKKYIELRQGESRETLANIQKAKDVLGWSPKISLLQYIDDTINKG